jgi:hypothetical protein
MATTPLMRAVRKAEKTLDQVATCQVEPSALYKVLDAVITAYNRDHTEQRDLHMARADKVRQGIGKALDDARQLRAARRSEKLAELDAQPDQGVRYVPGVGYARGKQVIG